MESFSGPPPPDSHVEERLRSRRAWWLAALVLVATAATGWFVLDRFRTQVREAEELEAVMSRIQALYEAESGLSEGLAQLSARATQGAVPEPLAFVHGSSSIGRVVELKRTGGELVLHSEGYAGDSRRRLAATLSHDSTAGRYRVIHRRELNPR